MKTRFTSIAAAALLALTQMPLTATAQDAKAPVTAAPAAPAAAQPMVAAKAPTEWIQYEDTTYTPVVDDVSGHLAAARTALTEKDNAKAADAMRAAARALQLQADHAGKIERRRAAADMNLARDTHARMDALVRKLDATAADLQAGKVTSTAQLDKVIGKAARADLERRWLVTDVATWYPVAEEPQRHFAAAAKDIAMKDYKAAATEVREASAFVRLESNRAVGEAKKGLKSARAGLDSTARALDKGALKSVHDMDKAFATANHALAVAHRAKAAESWARKAYDTAGYELKASAQSLESAAAWTGDRVKSGEAAASSGARAVGDKLASGGVWARDEVAKGFDSLGGALNKLGHSIGARSKAAPFDANVGA
ncbi:MAG: hypothetical protein ABIQ60_05035 [Burkholderiaceae bacterium]